MVGMINVHNCIHYGFFMNKLGNQVRIIGKYAEIIGKTMSMYNRQKKINIISQSLIMYRQIFRLEKMSPFDLMGKNFILY